MKNLLQEKFTWWIPIAIALIFQAIFFLTLTSNISLDFSEQILISQQGWLLGYHEQQPPLYTWLFLLVSNIFGVTKLTFAIQTYTLLGLMFTFIYFTAKRIIVSPKIAAITTFSYLIIGIFAKRVPMDMTNSVLLACVIAATAYVLIRLLEKPNAFWYSMLGLCFGVGILSKWNYTLVLFSILLAWLISSQFRSYLFNKYIFNTFIITFLIIVTPLIWVYLYEYSITTLNDQYLGHHTAENYLSRAMESVKIFASEFINFMLPLIVIILISFGKLLLKPTKSYLHIMQNISDGAKLIGMVVGIGTLIILISVLCGYIIRLHWLVTPFMLLPLFIFSWIEGCQPTKMQWKIYIVTLLIALCVTTALSSMRYVVRGDVCSTCLKLHKFTSTIPAINNIGFEKGIIVTNNIMFAGNLQSHFPNSIFLLPDELKINYPTIANPYTQDILVLWETDNAQSIKDALDTIGFIDLPVTTHTGIIGVPIHSSKKNREIPFYYTYYPASVE